jgi:hypothetical protein
MKGLGLDLKLLVGTYHERTGYYKKIILANSEQNEFQLNYIRTKHANTSLAWIYSIFLVNNLPP